MPVCQLSVASRAHERVDPRTLGHCCPLGLRSVGVWGPGQTGVVILVLLFTSLFTIPLSRQRLLHAAFLAGLEVEGMTFDFFNDVFLLDLALKPAQCIFKRLAFLNANLCQRTTPPDDPRRAKTRVQETGVNNP